MALRLYPLPTLFDATVQRLRNATPVNVSSFYLRRPYNVPWSVNPSPFTLETDEPDALHHFEINRTDRFSLVPGSSPYPILLQLAKGANRIEVSTATDRFYVTVAATAIETWFRALGREFFAVIDRRLTEIRTNFASPWTTRISAHLLPYADMLLPARMPKIHQTRLAILTSMGGRLGHGDGVLNVATALSYSTPVVTKQRDAEFCLPGRDHLYPGVTSHPTTGELAGRLLDLWSPNQCLAAKDALIRLAFNLGSPDVIGTKPIEIIDFNDMEVLLKFAGGSTETHLFDVLAPECADIENSVVCGRAVVSATLSSVIDIAINTPQLTLDEAVDHPLGFGFWDEGSTLDGEGGAGLGGGDDTFDTVDPDDPYGDGFYLFPLSRRLDHACFDTATQMGERLVKYTVPIDSSPPIGTITGSPFIVDGAVGAPPPTAGNTVVWGVSPQVFIYDGDFIRAGATEFQILSSWPAFPGTDYIIKSEESASDGSTGSRRAVVAPPGFFEQQHKGMGLRVDGAEFYSIVAVSDDGSEAVVAGNPTALPGGTFIINVYEPLRDRNKVGFLEGRRVFEVTLSPAIAADLADGSVLDHRIAPRAVGDYLAGDEEVEVASDAHPRPGNYLYVTETEYYRIDHTEVVGSHHTSGMPIYRLRLASPLVDPIADDAVLYCIRAQSCFPHGDPVTPLVIYSMEPPDYLEV